MILETILDQLYMLPEPSKQRLKAAISEVSFRKGHTLLRAQHIEKSIYFIKKGIARAYAPMDGKDITFWFGEEGDTVLSMRSYVEGKPAYENVELLEDSTLYELPIPHIEALYKQDIHIANWGRKLAENELLKLESRVIATEFLSASARYDAFLKHSPGILKRAPLKYIASYLGITQVSLSRIRKTS